MLIKQIINNNVLLAEDQTGAEFVVMGKGLAFNRAAGHPLDESKIERTFIVEPGGVSKKIIDTVEKIPTEIIEAVNQILLLAEESLSTKFGDTLYFSLADHIQFAVERYRNGEILKNHLLWEIKRFYKKEFEISLEAIRIIEKFTRVQMDEDEAGFITLHLVNGQQEFNQQIQQTVAMTKLLQGIISIVTYHYKTKLDEDTFNYQRFLTHLQFLVQRLYHKEINIESSEDSFLFEQVKTKYVKAFKCAEKINIYLKNSQQVSLSNDELVFLTVHIHRVTKRNNQITVDSKNAQ